MTQTIDFRAIIRKRLKDLGERMQDIETELDTPKSKDLGEQAIDLEDDEVLETLGLSAEREADALYRALRRLEGGTFGLCASCGETISDARLQVVPHTLVCRKCAAAAAVK